MDGVVTQKDLDELRAEFKSLSDIVQDVVRRLTVVEVNHASVEDDVREQKALISEIRKQLDSLANSSTETKVQINMIFSTLHEIKQSITALQKDDQDARKEHHSAWMDFFKQIIYFLIMFVMSYVGAHLLHH